MPDDWFMEYVAFGRMVIRLYLYRFYDEFLLFNPRTVISWPEPKRAGFKKAEYRNEFGIPDENIRLCVEKSGQFSKMMIINHGFFYKQQVTFD
jgi:hypothetical protein